MSAQLLMQILLLLLCIIILLLDVCTIVYLQVECERIYLLQFISTYFPGSWLVLRRLLQPGFILPVNGMLHLQIFHWMTGCTVGCWAPQIGDGCNSEWGSTRLAAASGCHLQQHWPNEVTTGGTRKKQRQCTRQLWTYTSLYIGYIQQLWLLRTTPSQWR